MIMKCQMRQNAIALLLFITRVSLPGLRGTLPTNQYHNNNAVYLSHRYTRIFLILYVIYALIALIHLDFDP